MFIAVEDSDRIKPRAMPASGERGVRIDKPKLELSEIATALAEQSRALSPARAGLVDGCGCRTPRSPAASRGALCLRPLAG